METNVSAWKLRVLYLLHVDEVVLFAYSGHD